jgi:hypothetical protein
VARIEGGTSVALGPRYIQKESNPKHFWEKPEDILNHSASTKTPNKTATHQR